MKFPGFNEFGQRAKTAHLHVVTSAELSASAERLGISNHAVPGVLLAPDLRTTGFRSFREFMAWQLAYGLRRAVRPLCARALSAKDFNMCTQIREAARSAPRNIAEGFGRYAPRDFARFVRIAKASEVELLNHLQEAFDSGYLSAHELQELEHSTRKAIKAANGLIRYLDSVVDR